MVLKILADNLRKFRLERGHTQEWMAKQINVDRSTYTKYEMNATDPPLPTCMELCRVLEIIPNDLFGWKSEKT